MGQTMKGLVHHVKGFEYYLKVIKVLLMPHPVYLTYMQSTS